MGRFCYISKILPGKSELVRKMWSDRTPNEEPNIHAEFWNDLGMTGFESWLQPTAQGDFMIHCLEGESLQQIFKGLRGLIAKGNPFALKLQNFYHNVLGKDYALRQSEPHIESMLDISLPSSAKILKRSFFFPLLPYKEEAHRLFRKESMGEKKERHEASMSAFGVSRLSTWLQNTPEGNYIVVYSERHIHTPTTPAARLNQGEGSRAWQEISSILSDHTGLRSDELSPDSEWLTRPK
jgi:hypothetical protein